MKTAKITTNTPRVYIRLPNVDWKLLRKQKALLNKLAKDPALTVQQVALIDGVLGILDHVQDEAANFIDSKTIFGK